MGRTFVRVLALVVALVALAACELRTEVNITVSDDGSGTVEIAVAIDAESAALRPDLLGDLDVDHLVEAGWEVTGPVPEDDFEWVRARHGFDDPSEVTGLVAAVVGDDGPFRDFRVTRRSSFASESTSFTGTVDFGAIGDGDVAEDVIEESDVAGVPAEDVIDQLGERFGAAVDDIVRVTVAVRLPGDVESNAPTKATNGAVWRPSVTADGPLVLEATGTSSRTGRVAVVVGAVVVAVVAVLAGSVRLALWRRRK